MTRPHAPTFPQRIAERTGLAPDLLDRPALEGFVVRRCGELKLPNPKAYQELVLRDPDELDRLVQEVSVAETWFFRYPASFELLTRHAARLWQERRASLRMLSVACATGEEPYSMAMAAAQAGWPLDRILVDAIDRHEPSLAIARSACYRQRSFREPLPSWAEPWLRREARDTHVDARLAARVRFACQDALKAERPGDGTTYDVVFCRNLFIYLHGTARGMLVDGLSHLLSADGLLFVGHAECAILPTDRFALAEVSHAFALRPKRSSQPPGLNPPDGTRTVTPTPVRPPRKQPAPPRPEAPLPRSTAPQPAATLAEARALADAGQVDAAIAVLQDIQSPLPDVYDLLGSIQVSRGQWQEARDAFRKVLYFDPHHETALLHMAVVSEQLGEPQQAARYRRRAARAHLQNTPPQP